MEPDGDKLLHLDDAAQEDWAIPALEKNDITAETPRLEGRVAGAAEAEGEEEDGADEGDDKRYSRKVLDTANGVWGDKPSVKDQRARFPDSVRARHAKTEILKLEPGFRDLKRWNEIEEMLYDAEAPRYVMTQFERVFHDGVFYVYVTLSKLEYQQL